VLTVEHAAITVRVARDILTHGRILANKTVTTVTWNNLETTWISCAGGRLNRFWGADL